ncbi:MAG: hypothetical protein NVSMB55_08560 [Mycobacteriales bacterium]
MPPSDDAAHVRPELSQIMRSQRGVFRRSQALEHYTRSEVEHRMRAGTWVTVRHGVYTTAAIRTATATDERRAHLLAAAARQVALSGDTILSHQSAALFHRLELLRPAAEPQLTLHRPEGAGRLTAHGLYVAPVPDAHRIAGLPVTTAARTVADCARTLDREAAVVTAESALRLGLDRLAVLDVLDSCAGWPGSAEARDVMMFASPWSESALESRARCWFAAQQLPQPQQQRIVRRVGGGFVARVDFVWEHWHTVCELDGRRKYDDPRALWEEKLREDVLRDLGLEVVRGYWTDGDDVGAALAERLRRAFRRGRRSEEPAYRLLAPQPPRHLPLAS